MKCNDNCQSKSHAANETRIAKPNQIGFVSGISWGFGYFGAIACLMLALIIFIQAKEPPFGLSWNDAGPVRATMILAGIWLFVFSIPAFLFVKEENTSFEKMKLSFKVDKFSHLIGIQFQTFY